jgi:hypothetical protein
MGDLTSDLGGNWSLLSINRIRFSETSLSELPSNDRVVALKPVLLRMNREFTRQISPREFVTWKRPFCPSVTFSARHESISSPVIDSLISSWLIFNMSVRYTRTKSSANDFTSKRITDEAEACTFSENYVEIRITARVLLSRDLCPGLADNKSS